MQPFIVWRLPTIDISERSLCSEALQMFSGTRNVAKKYSYALQSTNFPGSTPHVFSFVSKGIKSLNLKTYFLFFLLLLFLFLLWRDHIFGHLVNSCFFFVLVQKVVSGQFSLTLKVMSLSKDKFNSNAFWEFISLDSRIFWWKNKKDQRTTKREDIGK